MPIDVTSTTDTTKAEEAAIFALADIEVDTLGLVSRGANREEFFLMKNATEGTPAAETNDAAVAATVTQTIWQRLINLFQKAALHVESEDDDAATATGLVATTDAAAATSDSESESEDDDEAEAEAEAVMTKTDVVAEPASAPEIIKEEARVDPETIEIAEPIVTIKTEDVMAEENISKAEYETIAKRLEVAEVELAKARAEKEQQVWLTKAAGFGYLPVAQTELAAHLYNLAKLDEAEAQWVVDVLKAVDNMVTDSGMFVEKGHNLPEVDAVTKAMQAADPKAALLGLPKAQAEAYLSAVRGRIRK